MRLLRRALAAAALIPIACLAAACADGGGGRIGDPCDEDGECESGLCFRSVCIDPVADADGDGLSNGVEVALGTDPEAADSDGDGVTDPDEVGAVEAPRDADGDGRIDAVESLLADADADCLVDQEDAEDDVPDGPCGGGAACGDGPPCPAGERCNVFGVCEPACRPDCRDRECGADGCGGACPPGCGAGYRCEAGVCVAGDCVPDCAADPCAADDGCGGVCDACPGGEGCTMQGDCAVLLDCVDYDACVVACGPDAPTACLTDCANRITLAVAEARGALLGCVTENCGRDMGDVACRLASCADAHYGCFARDARCGAVLECLEGCAAAPDCEDAADCLVEGTRAAQEGVRALYGCAAAAFDCQGGAPPPLEEVPLDSLAACFAAATAAGWGDCGAEATACVME